MAKIIKKTVFTDRVKVSRIMMDASPEIVFIGKFFDLERGKYQPYQMVCQVDVFMKVVIMLEESHPGLFRYITDAIPGLSDEVFVIDGRELPRGGLVLTDSIFALTAIEFYSEIENKYVYKFQNPDAFEETKVRVQINENLPSIPTKLDLSQPTLILFDLVRFKSAFDPRQHWVKEINENPKFLPFANEIYHLQIRYRYYLHLRSLGESHKAAKMTAGIREVRVFALAKRCWEAGQCAN